MPVPLIAYPVVGAIAWLGRKLTSSLFIVGGSLIAKSIVVTIIGFAISYIAVTKFDAVSYFIEFIISRLESSNISLGETTINISSVGAIIQALRIEDILIVYLNAIFTAYMLKLMASAVSLRRSN